VQTFGWAQDTMPAESTIESATLTLSATLELMDRPLKGAQSITADKLRKPRFL
jgi:hypothetical protein